MKALIILFFIFSVNVYSQTWSMLGSGMDNNVNSLIVYNNELIAGGQFSFAGGDTARRIAKWNGTNWSQLGSGLGGNVQALIIYNNELLAAVGYLLKWNKTTWEPFVEVTGGSILALVIYKNELIAAGNFTSIGGVNANGIAKWNGTNWSPLGIGVVVSLSDRVRALTLYNNELVVGGRFNYAGGLTLLNIAKWNDTTWASLGTGIGITGSDVYSLTTYNNELIAGGKFTTAGGISANNIARWNGTSWSILGGGITGTPPVIPGIVMSMFVYNNQLYAGGQFTYAGGSSANYIAKWNGSNWSPLGSGMAPEPYPNVHALVVFNNELIAGGRFITAGGMNSPFIAKWGTLTGINNNSEIPKKFSLSQNYPNPFNPKTNIEFAIPKSSSVKLVVYDVLGKEIAVLVNEELKAGTYNYDWDATNFASGIYYYKLLASNYTETKKMILIK